MDGYKLKRLECVKDKWARNLLSLMLAKDPTKRLSMIRVLTHPFLTGKHCIKMLGESAANDIFLSYRVDSDSVLVQLLHEILTTAGLNVYWDK